MNFPIGQHYIPKLLLRKFTDPSGYLYFYRKDWGLKEIKKATPHNIFKERYLYTKIDQHGEKDFSLDSFYQNLESDVSPIINKLIHNSKKTIFPLVSNEDRECLDLFIYNLWRRVPDIHKKFFNTKSVEESIIDIKEHLERLGETIPKEDLLLLSSQDTIDRIMQSGKVTALFTNGKRVLKTLSSMTISSMVIRDPNKAFIIGSHPLLKLSTAENSNLSFPSTEVWIPISSDIALCYNHHSEKVIDATNMIIRQLNLTTTKFSTMIAGRSENLIRSLTNPR